MLNILQISWVFFLPNTYTDFGTRYIVHLDIIKDEQLLQSYRKGPVVAASFYNIHNTMISYNV